MEVIPPEDEPAHPAIRRIFNNPLIPRKARSGSLRSPLKKKLPIKRVKLPVKKGIDYQKQQVKKEIPKIKVLDLSLAKNINFKEEEGILSLPCDISMTGKQSASYNVKGLTKDKASALSSSQSSRSCLHSFVQRSNLEEESFLSVASQKMTPTVTIINGEVSKHKDFSSIDNFSSSCHQRKLVMTAASSRRHLLDSNR